MAEYACKFWDYKAHCVQRYGAFFLAARFTLTLMQMKRIIHINPNLNP